MESKIIHKALVTEKANYLLEGKAQYTFLVTPNANKIEIKNAISSYYGVEVASISTMIYAPKVKRKFTKAGLQIGKTNKLKKAIVTLVDGQEIDLFNV